MKPFWLILLAVCMSVSGQESLQALTVKERTCRDAACKARVALQISEWYNEKDHIEKAQSWLEYAKVQHRKQPDAEMELCLYSMQAELFYYMGLYQFGIHEAEKEIEEAAARRNRFFLYDGWFFKGINLFESGKTDLAEKSLWKAKYYLPEKPRRYPRTYINPAYLYNNLAQIKIKKAQTDSALFYNRQSYKLAVHHQIRRAQANAEQLFGEIFLATNNVDSARYYFMRSAETATNNQIYDVALISTGFLMKVSPQSARVPALYKQGVDIIGSHEVNNLYKTVFFNFCLDVFKKRNDLAEIVRIQEELLALKQETGEMKNYYVQGITNKYMNTENHLLQARINDLDQERKLTAFQLVAAVFGILVLLFGVLFFRRKSRLQQMLLEQKNEISKDLHDDIGSELSSIMINTTLLRMADSEKREALIDKIHHTATEISQRVNAFIWSLDNENDTVGNFAEYVKHLSVKLFEGTNVSVSVTDDLTNVSHRILNGYFRKNLIFCVKEALNNAFRHSGGTAISVMIQGNEKSGLQITITDNGKGIGTENSFGNGLNNIRKRVAVLQGTVRFVNKDGLSVMISVPFPSK